MSREEEEERRRRRGEERRGEERRANPLKQQNGLLWPRAELEERGLGGGRRRREDKEGGSGGAKKWMERVQSKSVIVKQMKELRFCGGVNIELANLWTSKPALLTATVTMSPICIPVCLLESHSPCKACDQTSCKKKVE